MQCTVHQWHALCSASLGLRRHLCVRLPLVHEGITRMERQNGTWYIPDCLCTESIHILSFPQFKSFSRLWLRDCSLCLCHTDCYARSDSGSHRLLSAVLAPFLPLVRSSAVALYRPDVSVCVQFSSHHSSLPLYLWCGVQFLSDSIRSVLMQPLTVVHHLCSVSSQDLFLVFVTANFPAQSSRPPRMRVQSAFFLVHAPHLLLVAANCQCRWTVNCLEACSNPERLISAPSLSCCLSTFYFTILQFSISILPSKCPILN